MHTPFNRRELLVSLAALSGCASQDSSGPRDTGATDSADDTYTIASRIAEPTDLNWNPYVVNAPSAVPVDRLIYESPLVQGFYPREAERSAPEFLPQNITGYEQRGSTLTVSLREDGVWADGDPVVAEDYLVQYRIQKILGQGTLGTQSAPVWDEITAEGDYEVTFELRNDSPNEEVLLPLLLTNKLQVKRGSQLHGVLEAHQDATTDSERQEQVERFTTLEVSEPVGNAVWSVDEVSSNRILLAPNPDHRHADELDYRVEVKSILENNKWHLELSEDLVDGLYGAVIPPSIQESLPEHTRGIEYRKLKGDAFRINFANEDLSRRPVRQALAHLVDREQNVYNARETASIVRYITGLPNSHQEEWLGENPEGFQTYGVDASNEDRAAPLLRDAGYRKDGEWWQTPSGDRFTLDVLTPGSGTWPLNAQTLVGTLEAAGIQAEQRVRDMAGYWNDYADGEWDLVIGVWGAEYGGNHPYQYFSSEFKQRMGQNQNVDLTTIEVPYPVGDPDGSLQSVDVTEKTAALATTTDEAAERDLIRELAWIYNQSLPKITLNTNVGNVWFTTDDWQLPDIESKYMKFNPMYTLLTSGQLQSR
jgi:peptide/nickel transport system substrate-binding protein